MDEEEGKCKTVNGFIDKKWFVADDDSLLFVAD
jgi:hypothetical protein